MPLILPGNVASAIGGGYEVANSCRFNDGDSPALHKTPGSDGNKRIFTISVWSKKTTNENQGYLWDGGTTNENPISWGPADTVKFGQWNGSSDDFALDTAAKFRDPSAWYHVCVKVDTTQSTDTNRVKIYVNGTEQTLTGTYPTQNLDMYIGTSGSAKYIGRPVWTSSARRLDGYIAEFCYIDGSALAPTEFGEFDEDSPTIWKPKDVSGLTFGTNGFYLDYEDSANLGNDANGGTDLTETNIAATDQCVDTPTNNFCTMNPLDNYYQGSTFSEGNTIIVTGSGSQAYNTSTIYVTSGKWYVEVKPTAGSATSMIGIAGELANGTDGNDVQLQYKTYGWCYKDDGNVFNNNTADSGTWASYTTNDIIGIAINLDTLQGGLNKLYFSKNGSWQNSADPTDFDSTTGVVGITKPASTTIGAYAFAVNETWDDNTRTYSFNFGNPSFSISSGNADGNGYGNFEYAPPSGYYSICSKNLAEYG